VEQPDRAGQGELEVGRQLVGERDAGFDQVLAGTGQRPQRQGRVGVALERPEPSVVGAQHVSEHERVQRVVLVACAAVAATQVLHLPRVDHEHLHAGVEQRFDHRPIRPFDRHPLHTVFHEAPGHRGKSGRGVGELVAGQEPAGVVHDRAGMAVLRPVDRARGRRRR
jgi:hypothetical protein